MRPRDAAEELPADQPAPGVAPPAPGVDSPAPVAGLRVGDVVEVEVGAVAHGGHCVARRAGQVLFVRHCLPGELVAARVTSVGPKGRFVRADAVEVLRGHRQRVVPACPVAVPGGCGGCDWQHASPELARELKGEVLREAMLRFAGVELAPDTQVADVGSNPGGLGWRTRADLAVDDAGRAGFRRHRSNEVVAVTGCPLLVDPGAAGAFAHDWQPGGEVRFVAPASGPALAFPAGRAPVPVVLESAAGRDWQVSPEGFWQVHPRAGDVLAGAVLAALGPLRNGDRVLDLYAGVGLFAGAVVASAQAESVRVGIRAVESDPGACRWARENLGAKLVTRAPVQRWVADPRNLAGVSHVVLDPPRSGAGREVMAALAGSVGRRIVYVACDPVALARDTATLLAAGWRIGGVVAFDLFPSTHHFETVAWFRREPAATG